MSDELISPELALVCPELRAKAIAGLPATQPWFPRQLNSAEAPSCRVPRAADDRARTTARSDSAVARAAGAYLFGRATALLGIAAGITLCVLILAAVAGAVRG